MDTEKQRQRRHNDVRLTESGNARSEQLNTHGAYRVANQQSLACLSGSECRRPGQFLDMKYQTCFCWKYFVNCGWASMEENANSYPHRRLKMQLVCMATKMCHCHSNRSGRQPKCYCHRHSWDAAL